MNKKHLAIYALLGGVGYYLYHKMQQNKAAQAQAAAAAVALQNQPLMSGSDSMSGGTLTGAILGLMDDAPRQAVLRNVLRTAGQANMNFRGW